MLSRKSDTRRAILYALKRQAALTRYCGDGRLGIDNLPVKRALRGVAIGWRNSYSSAQTWAESALQQYAAGSAPPNSMASIPRLIQASCLHASQITRSTVLGSFCAGTSRVCSSSPDTAPRLDDASKNSRC